MLQTSFRSVSKSTLYNGCVSIDYTPPPGDVGQQSSSQPRSIIIPTMPVYDLRYRCTLFFHSPSSDHVLHSQLGSEKCWFDNRFGLQDKRGLPVPRLQQPLSIGYRRRRQGADFVTLSGYGSIAPASCGNTALPPSASAWLFYTRTNRRRA